MEKNKEIIRNKNSIIAIIIRSNYCGERSEFFTPPNFSQQLGFISRRAGEIIGAHTHNIVERSISLIQETLFVKKGKVKVNLYDSERNYLESRILRTGDVILLARGGHGFEFLENTELVEVKQGPYSGEEDKAPFKGLEQENHDTGK